MSWKEHHIYCANTIHAAIQTAAEKGSALFSNPSPETTIVTQKKRERERELEREQERVVVR